MWSWRSASLCWWSCFCSTSSSLVATRLKTSYSLVINTTYDVHFPTCMQYISKEQRFTKVELYVTCIQCDFTRYVESCLDWSGSEESLARLFWGMTDTSPPCKLPTSMALVHTLNLLPFLPWLNKTIHSPLLTFTFSLILHLWHTFNQAFLQWFVSYYSPLCI